MKKLFYVLLAWLAAINLAFAAIDINNASEAELDKLPGIGPAKAKAIVEDRQKNGPFKNPEDLKRVKGIGDKTFDKLKSEITVSGGGAAKAAAKPAAAAAAPAKSAPAATEAKKEAKTDAKKEAKAEAKKEAKGDDKKKEKADKAEKKKDKEAKHDKKDKPAGDAKADDKSGKK